MAKVAFNSPLLRRAYTVAAENVKVVQSATGSVISKVTDLNNNKGGSSGRGGGGGGGELIQGAQKEEVFWMRDAKSGNWVPETHSNGDQLDAADLRNKFCSYNNKISTSL